MRLFLLYIARKSDPDAQPEPVEVIDENTLDENAPIWDELLSKWTKQSDIAAAHWFELSLHSDAMKKIREALTGAIRIDATFKGAASAVT